MQVDLGDFNGVSDCEKWEDPEILQELYVERRLGRRKIADRFGVSEYKIKYQLKKHGILRPEQLESFPADEDELRRLFFDELFTISDVVDELDSYRKKVERVKNHYGIELDNTERKNAISKRKASETPAGFFTTSHGYETATGLEYDGMKEQIGIHRLVAIAEFGFDAVAGEIVHHKNAIPWDNRPCNLEITNPASHIRTHWDSDLATIIGGSDPEEVEHALRAVGYEQAADSILCEVMSK